LPHRDSQQTGSFPIEGARRPVATLLPPPLRSVTESVQSFLDLAALANQAESGLETPMAPDADLDAIAVDITHAAEPEQELAPVLASTVVPRGQSAVEQGSSRLSSQFMTAPIDERAAIEIEDLSLRFDNPYLPSSLIPPKRKRLGRGTILIVTGALAGAVVSFAGSSLFPAASTAARNSERPTSTSELAIAPTPAPALLGGKPALPIAAAMAVAAEGSSDRTSQSSAPMPALAAPAQKQDDPTPRGARKPKVSARRQSGHNGRRNKPAKSSPRVSAVSAISQLSAPTASLSASAMPSLPQSPSRDEVVAVFGRLRAQIWRCAAGNKGVVEIQATITGEGRISNALIGGVFSGTPQGSCMARAVRGGSFSPVRQSKVTVSFPIAL
jgi:hypothetical protein